jgi:hypothetical protein
MKVLKLAGLGIVIWGLSLIWPEVNQFLTAPVMIGMLFGLGGVTVAYVLVRRFNHDFSDKSANQDHGTQPVPLAMIR